MNFIKWHTCWPLCWLRSRQQRQRRRRILAQAKKEQHPTIRSLTAGWPSWKETELLPTIYPHLRSRSGLAFIRSGGGVRLIWLWEHNFAHECCNVCATHQPSTSCRATPPNTLNWENETFTAYALSVIHHEQGRTFVATMHVVPELIKSHWTNPITQGGRGNYY